MTQDTHLPLAGDIIDYIKLNGQELEWLWRDGEAFIPIRPICEILGLSYPAQYRKLTGAESDARVAFKATTGADKKQYEMLCIAYPDFMMWLGNISPSRVKPEARAAMNTTRRGSKLLLANHYKQRLFGGMEGEHVPNCEKFAELGINVQKEPHENSLNFREFSIEPLTGDLFDTERSPRP
ncbi:MAG: hypothetical protein H2045_10600 [Rhizobiales bacterium]|nr:hypothetical protein [Hyphomicrobiales bacterium]